MASRDNLKDSRLNSPKHTFNDKVNYRYRHDKHLRKERINKLETQFIVWSTSSQDL